MLLCGIRFVPGMVSRCFHHCEVGKDGAKVFAVSHHLAGFSFPTSNSEVGKRKTCSQILQGKKQQLNL